MVELESQGADVEGGVERRDSGLLFSSPGVESSDPEEEKNPFCFVLRVGTELGKAGLEPLIRGEGLWRPDFENM